MKLSKRKYTTEKGLAELQDLIDNLEFCDDVNSVESEEFYARIDRDNGYGYGDMHYAEWTNTSGKWRIKGGEINIISLDSEGEENGIARIERINQLNFSDCLNALQEVVEKYNQECEKKDAQIEKFLKFCEDFKNNG